MKAVHEYAFELTVPDDDGELRTFQAYRVQVGQLKPSKSTAYPYKGGV